MGEQATAGARVVVPMPIRAGAGRTMWPRPVQPEPPPPDRTARSPFRILSDLAATTVRAAGAAAGEVAGAVLDGVGRVAGAGGRFAADTGRGVQQAVAAAAGDLVRGVVHRVLAELDLTAIVREHVDLNSLIRSEVDVDAIADRVDLERITTRVDVDAIADRIDLERIVARIDVDAIADRIDLQRIVARVDVDAIADRIDLQRILARIDVDAVAARIDLDAVVARLDLVALANSVIDGIDLPALVRESTGSLGAEAVRGVRVHGMRADDAVAGAVGRLLRRRRPEEDGG
jgi:hypothetical protein